VLNAEAGRDRSHHERDRSRDDCDHVRSGEVILHETFGIGVDRVHHDLFDPGDRLLGELLLALTAELNHHVERPAADVEDSALLLEVRAEAAQQVALAHLASLVAIAHVQRRR
jgi:hypothetical protein